jgi:hypothetical protein
MAKVKNPIKEIWESDKKPNCMVLIKDKKDESKGIVKAVKLKVKKRSKKVVN